MLNKKLWLNFYYLLAIKLVINKNLLNINTSSFNFTISCFNLFTNGYSNVWFPNTVDERLFYSDTNFLLSLLLFSEFLNDYYELVSNFNINRSIYIYIYI